MGARLVRERLYLFRPVGTIGNVEAPPIVLRGCTPAAALRKIAGFSRVLSGKVRFCLDTWAWAPLPRALRWHYFDPKMTRRSGRGRR